MKGCDEKHRPVETPEEAEAMISTCGGDPRQLHLFRYIHAFQPLMTSEATAEKVAFYACNFLMGLLRSLYTKDPKLSLGEMPPKQVQPGTPESHKELLKEDHFAVLRCHCRFCGLKTPEAARVLKCSRCKTARYCNVQCNVCICS